GTGALKLTLSVSHGTLNFGSTSGLSFVSGSNGSASLTVTGSLADLNSALSSLSYSSTRNYNGSDSLSVTVDDQGNSGSGGSQTATGTVG
ncbi:hypothetical protein ABTL73_20650, partial [Acinetobacter baumannii]